MINLNEEILAKAKQAKSVEELLTLAKESGIEMTAEQAQVIFAQLNQKSGELADDELDNVAGGGCYNGKGDLVVSAMHDCELWTCRKCGATGVQTEYNVSKDRCIMCSKVHTCLGCSFCFSQNGLMLCSNPCNRQ